MNQAIDNSIQLHGNPINSNKKSVLFVKQWIQAFFDELQLYSINNADGEPWRKYAERPMVGLLATGLTRSDKRGEISVLHEFGVYDRAKPKKQNFLGRCDLFISKDNCYYLAEFKYTSSRGGKNHFNDSSRSDFISKIHSQCARYLEAEKEDYDEGKVYLVCMVFNRISFKEKSKFDLYLKNAKSYTPTMKDSLFCYITSKMDRNIGDHYSALEVYGSVFEK